MRTALVPAGCDLNGPAAAGAVYLHRLCTLCSIAVESLCPSPREQNCCFRVARIIYHSLNATDHGNEQHSAVGGFVCVIFDLFIYLDRLPQNAQSVTDHSKRISHRLHRVHNCNFISSVNMFIIHLVRMFCVAALRDQTPHLA